MTIIHNMPKTSEFPQNDFWIFYGRPKTGKSTFAATWDKPLCFDLEAGYKYIEADIIMPESYKDFLKELSNPKTLKPYNTIIIDTLDLVYEWIEKETITELNLKGKTAYSSVGEFPHGNGWAISRLNLKKFVFNEIFKITRMNKNVIGIVHEKAITVKKGNIEDVEYKLSFPGQTATMIASLADVVGRIYSKKIAGRFEPRLSFIPGSDDDGSRLKILANKDMSLNIDTLRRVITDSKPKTKSKKLSIIANKKSVDKDKEEQW